MCVFFHTALLLLLLLLELLMLLLLLLLLVLLVVLVLMTEQFMLLLLLGLGHGSLLVHSGVHATDLRRMARGNDLLGTAQGIGVHELTLVVGVGREVVARDRTDVVAL